MFVPKALFPAVVQIVETPMTFPVDVEAQFLFLDQVEIDCGGA